MSEDVKQGEFYKKIDNEYDEYMQETQWDNTVKYFIGKEKIKKVLIEAKTEFPKPPSTLFTGSIYQQQIESDGEYKNRVWLWYCKWFGAP